MKSPECSTGITADISDISPNFYRTHAGRYAEINKLGLQRVYVEASHAGLKRNRSLVKHLKKLTWGIRGLDAGCGAGALDVARLLEDGYDIFGIDVIHENIQTGIDYYPHLKGRLWTSDLAQKLFFPDGTFDFVICNAVIQHIPPRKVYSTTLPELVRVLKPGGVLQIMFKVGKGIRTVFDEDYGERRDFQLFQEHEILTRLNKDGMDLIESHDDEGLGGLMYFTNPKGDRNCVFYSRKTGWFETLNLNLPKGDIQSSYKENGLKQIL